MNHSMLSKIAQAEVRAAVLSLPMEIQGVEADTLGLFDEGAPETPTPRIRLWLENLWDFAEDDTEVFRAEVRTTLLHEIGHLLGWDEQDVEERGLG